MKFDEIKKLMLSVIFGLELKRIDDENWDIGGVSITFGTVSVDTIFDKREVPTYFVTHGVTKFSCNRMEPDDVDVVEAGQYGSLEAAIPAAIQVCIQWALDNAAEALAEHEDIFA